MNNDTVSISWQFLCRTLATRSLSNTLKYQTPDAEGRDILLVTYLHSPAAVLPEPQLPQHENTVLQYNKTYYYTLYIFL